jgi:hypothetical protein
VTVVDAEEYGPKHGEHGVPGQGYQKRIDKLIRAKYDMQKEISGLRELLLRYEATIEKYKQALRRKVREQQLG